MSEGGKHGHELSQPHASTASLLHLWRPGRSARAPCTTMLPAATVFHVHTHSHSQSPASHFKQSSTTSPLFSLRAQPACRRSSVGPSSVSTARMQQQRVACAAARAAYKPAAVPAALLSRTHSQPAAAPSASPASPAHTDSLPPCRSTRSVQHTARTASPPAAATNLTERTTSLKQHRPARTPACGKPVVCPGGL